jgi:hypothetical protein
MKKNKLSLDNLRVTSFVTDLDNAQKDRIMGGAESIVPAVCNLTLQHLTNCGIITAYSNCNTCGIACTAQPQCNPA